MLAHRSKAGGRPARGNRAAHAVAGLALAVALLTTPIAAGDLMDPGSLKETAPDTFSVEFTTTKGSFVIDVTRAWSPIGADRFFNLVKSGYFDDAHFFRVVPNFVVQFGMNADPKVTQAWRAARLKDEPVKETNAVGTITYAKGGPNSRTTQVFINLRDNRRLDGMGFSPFGKVTKGMDIVKQLYGGYGDAPPGGSGPSQARIAQEGKPYLDKNYPKLDSIKSAKLVVEPAGDAEGD